MDKIYVRKRKGLDKNKIKTIITKRKNSSWKAHFALWFLMKSGPYLRNSTLSPKIGHPIVPGGKSFLLYFMSPHFNRAKQTQKAKVSPQNTKIVIDWWYQQSGFSSSMLCVQGSLNNYYVQRWGRRGKEGILNSQIGQFRHPFFLVCVNEPYLAFMYQPQRKLVKSGNK